MDKEKVYEYIEEADRRETMEILDAAANRFRELYADQELILLALPKNNRKERSRLIAQAIKMLNEQA
ncbi:MAG: hypothetical protein IJA45_09235 [Oscillospiraceae bacterium]|nr:hypothetical protein [Oscillospiraceae bacterium]